MNDPTINLFVPQYRIIKHISIENFFLYYIFSFILLVNYKILTDNFTNISTGLIAMAWVIFLAIFVLKLYSDFHYFKYPKPYVLYSSLLSFIFLYILSLGAYELGNMDSWTYNNFIGPVLAWYFIFGFLCVMYHYRTNFFPFLNRFKHLPRKFINASQTALRFCFKLTLIPAILDW